MKFLKSFTAIIVLVLFCFVTMGYATLPTDLADREFNKFQEVASGDVAVLVTTSTATPSATTIFDGRATVTAAGTAEVINATTLPFSVCDIQSEENNTGDIVIGGTTTDATLATRSGILLYPGDFYTIKNHDLLYIYIDAEVSGDGVHYTCTL